MTGNRNNEGGRLFAGGVDWVSVGIYLLLVLMGWLNIYAAVYDEAHASIFDIGQRYGMQGVWIGVSLFMGLVVLLLDDKYYHILAYPLYGLSLLLLAATLVVGREVNGAKSWIFLGPVALQPAEFVKFTTALALARLMSTYSFSIRKTGDILRICVLLLVPMAIILLQNDTGSAIVYTAFAFVLYREGLNGWLYLAMIMVVSLFVFSFLLSPAFLLVLLIVACTLFQALGNGNWRESLVYVSGVALLTLAFYFLGRAAGWGFTLHGVLLAVSLLSLIPVAIYAYRARLRTVYLYLLLFLGSITFTYMTDFAFGKMQPHQQERILDLFGIENDLQGAGYNVNQSKIAIGSGGLTGKGFLNGTQTKYNFVPEQSTDFIFCTVGEEWGFAGALVVLALFCILILRIMKMGERQMEPFGRIYCYSVAAVFLFHVFVNVGMTIGVMPVIGIPLPFFSYGGSSLISFTLLFFVAVRLDAGKRRELPVD